MDEVNSVQLGAERFMPRQPYHVRKATLARLRADGMCHRCHARPKEVGVRCQWCAEQQREYNRLYMRKTYHQRKEKRNGTEQTGRGDGGEDSGGT